MKKTLAFSLICVALLTACAPLAAPPPESGGDAPAQVQAQAPTLPPAAPTAQTPATVPAAAPTVEIPTAAPTEMAYEVKEDFVATDPATVQLALGKPQFVEFFSVY